MTGRVFSKLLFSFLLVVCIGTAVLDFSVRRIVEHSLYGQAQQYDEARAAAMAAELAALPDAELAAVVHAQAMTAHANVTVTDTQGHALAEALLDPRAEAFPAAEVERTVRSGGRVMHFGFSLEYPQATLRLLRRDLLLASLLALLIAGMTAALMARRVAQRLSRIVQFANRITAGDFSARIEEGRLDEISEVAHALDLTAAQLEESFRALDGSRRELAVLLDSMQEAVLGISPQQQVTWSNSRMKGICPAVGREGRPLVECIRDPEVLRCVQEAIRENAVGRGRATSFVPGRVFAVSAAPMPGGGAVAVLYDVTDVERVERLRRDFVANVSHELRTPLTSITGYVETVLEGEERLSSQSREFLSIVLRNANRMGRLTVDLLALANVESGDYRVSPQRVPADVLLDDALDALAGMAMESDIALERDEAPDTLVFADLDALNQVFGNLIENAMKYGRAGKRVRVGARRSQDSDVVAFFVQDFGPGIALEHAERIFERFYRVDKARSRDSGGTGLGLAIVKHIVQAHGGQVWVESELGSGATFLFTLPVAGEQASG
jgi:two-component system phosphate regulon sensor histidine kinase PhoR